MLILYVYIDFTIEKSYTDFSYRTSLTIKRVSYNDSGNYTCGVKTSEKEMQFQNTTLIVKGKNSLVVRFRAIIIHAMWFYTRSRTAAHFRFEFEQHRSCNKISRKS